MQSSAELNLKLDQEYVILKKTHFINHLQIDEMYLVTVNKIMERLTSHKG